MRQAGGELWNHGLQAANMDWRLWRRESLSIRLKQGEGTPFGREHSLEPKEASFSFPIHILSHNHDTLHITWLTNDSHKAGVSVKFVESAKAHTECQS